MKPLIMNIASDKNRIANKIDTNVSIIPPQIPVVSLIVAVTQLTDRTEFDM